MIDNAKEFIDILKKYRCVGVCIDIKKDLPVTVNREYQTGKKSVTANLIDLINAEDLTVVLTRIDELSALGAGSLRVNCRFVPENKNYLICCEMNREKRLGRTLDSLFGVIIDIAELNKDINPDPTQQELLLLKKNMEKFSNLSAAKDDMGIVKIVGREKLARIQLPFHDYFGLETAILTETEKFICSADPAQTKCDIKKYKYSRTAYIKINQRIYAVWVLAADDISIIERCATTHDILAESLTKIANSYVMIHDEMVNSEYANKMLSETIEQQMLLSNIYAKVLKERNTADTIGAVVGMTADFLDLDRVLIYETTPNALGGHTVHDEEYRRVHEWNTPRKFRAADILEAEPRGSAPEAFTRSEHPELFDKLGAYETYFSNNPVHDVLGIEFSSYVASNLNADGLKYGIILYVINNAERVLSHAEKRLLRSISQIIAVVTLRCRDNRELDEKSARLHHLAYWDPALDVKNKTSLGIDLTEALQGGLSGAAVAFTLTNIKSINKIEGRDCRDKLVLKVLEYVKDFQSQNLSAEPYRFSDNIFMVLLKDADANAVKEFCESFIERFRRPWQISEADGGDDGRYLEITAGAALFPNAGTTAEELYLKAEMAMDNAKVLGVNSFTFYSGEYVPTRDDDYFCAQILREAVENDMDGVTVKYMPVYSAKTNSIDSIKDDMETVGRRIVSYEALVAISEDIGGSKLFTPAIIMQIAEKMGIDSTIDAWLTRRACEFCVRARSGTPDMTVSVSVSALSLVTGEVVAIVKRALEKSGLPPEALSLQFSERVAAVHYDRLLVMLPELKKLGVSIILDHVGSYYMASTLLRHSAISGAKTDITVMTSRIDDFTDTYVAGLVQLARDNGICIGVRSVEIDAHHKNDLTGAIAQGADWYQGDLHSHSISEEQAIELLPA